MKYYIKNIIFFNIYITLYASDYCPKSKPIIYNNNTECEIRKCTEEELNDNICIISNEKAKIQWLNNILFNKDKEEEDILNLGVTPSNKEILFSSFYTNNEDMKTIIFYNISRNNNKLEIMNIINGTYSMIDLECSILPVKINNTIDDYFLVCCEDFCDLVNYNSKEILSFKHFNSSGYCFCVNMIELNYNKNYLIANTCQGMVENVRHLSISKCNFSFNEINNSIEINIDRKYLSEVVVMNEISCFRTEKNIIECMTVNNYNILYIFLFDEMLNIKDKIQIDNNTVSEIYVQCIHLQKEIGVYTYMYDNEELDSALKIIDLIYNEDENSYQLNDIINCSTIIDTDCSDLVEIFKITNKRFIIFYRTNNNEFLITLCDLYGKNDILNNLMARYYKIPLILYSFTNTFNHKGFKYENYVGTYFIDQHSPVIIIFGFSNISQPDIIENINNINSINNNNNLYYTIKINDYLNNNVKINNNLFGYEFIGIKIIIMTGISSGIQYYLKSNNNLIKENDIIKFDDEINIDFSNAKVKIKEEFYLEISPIIGESEYEQFNSYADKIEIYGEEEQKNYFIRQSFEGKSFKIKFNFGCHKNCGSCEYAGITPDNQKCLSCKNNEGLCFMNNENNCFNINSLTYNYYYNEIGTLICTPLNGKCPENYPFEDKKTKECKEIISFNDLVLETHKFSNNKNVMDKVIRLIYEEIKSKNYKSFEELIINLNDNSIIQITSSENQEYNIDNILFNNISSINLNECEEILKKDYNIKTPLIIIKLDIKRNDTPSTQVEYQIINPNNFEILNLSICNNTKIDVFSPVNLSYDYLELIKQLKDQGYDIFNPEDSFYNDICAIYNSENNTDIILRDRKIDFYDPNLILCEESCDYKSFNVNTSKVNCKCDVKTEFNYNINEIKFSPNILIENFYSFEKYTNYKVLKCYKLVFDLERLKNNKGSYILFIIIILFILNMIINFITQNKIYGKILDEIIYMNSIIDKKIKIKKENNENYENYENYENNEIDIFKNTKKQKLEIKRIKKVKFTQNNKNDFHQNKDLENNNNKSDLKNKKNCNESDNISSIFESSSIRKQIANNLNEKEENILKNRFPLNTKMSNKSLRLSGRMKKNTHNNTRFSPKIRKNTNKNLRSSSKLKKDSNKNVSLYNETVNKTKIIREISPKERITQIIENIPKEERCHYFNDNELNELKFLYAIEIDFRSFFQFYWSLLKTIHPLFFTFILKHDYNLFFIKLSLFLFSFALNITLNTLFFTDDSMHKLYEDYGKLDFIYNLPKSIYSVLLSSLVTYFFELLSLSEDKISKFKEIIGINNIHMLKNKQIYVLKIQSFIFFILGLFLLTFFWYYISCFCAVYYNAQITLIKDIIISFIIGLLYPLLLTFIPTIIRIQGLRKKNSCLYSFSKLLSFAINLI